ncbi:MAG: hypothetical protein KOO60_10955 [Gemmatimonadales bacterium]|nr:hypothetical protein [Gemmatimonadales bacterium]
MATDGGSPNPNPNPDGSGGSLGQSGNSGGGDATGQIPAELRVAAANLGIELVPAATLAEYKKVHGSVKHGNIGEKLNRLNKLEEAETVRKDGELSELERATGSVTTLKEEGVALADRNLKLALRIGFLTENAKRAMPDSKDVAVFPEIMDLHMPALLAEFKGGDADEFVQDGLGKLVEIQARFAQRFGGGPRNGPGGESPASPSGAQGAAAPRREGSVVAQGMKWQDEVAFTQHPHIVHPQKGGGKR